ncbi:MAG: hypothetical protein PHT07_20845 [Paludibacter sp.]|nr:hypothetical protein [Paludibacter sp.]
MMNALMAIYYKPELSNDALRIWFGKLEKYDFDVVCKAFDKYIDSSSKPPEPSDIISLCQHKVTIFSALPSPLTRAANKKHADEVVEFVAKNMKPRKDYKAWAKKILSDKDKCSDIQIRYAKEALRDD